MRRTLAAVGAAFAFVVLTATPAFAHASLESSDPAANAARPAGDPPADITLTFTEGVQVQDDAITLLDANGERVEDVGPAAHGGSDSIVDSPLPPLDDGTYIVNWQVVSTDSHPITGAFTFSVGEPTADADTVAALLESDTGRGVGISFALTRAIAFAGVLVLVGALVFLRIGWPPAAEDRGVRGLVWLAWAVALVTAPLGISLQAAYTNRSEISAAWDTGAIGDVLDTLFGQGWLARIATLLLAIPFVRKPGAKRAPFVTGLEVALGIALLASVTISGHARTGRLTSLATTTDLVHMAAAAVWLGGLSVLVVMLCRRVRPRGSLEAVNHFSDIAPAAIVVIIISGIVQSLRQTDGLQSFVDTTYGRLLLAKIGLVIVILAAASASRAIVRGRIMPNLMPAGAGASRLNSDPEDTRDLRNAVVVEVVFAALVLIVTAALVNTEPARGAVADDARTDAAAEHDHGTVPPAGYDTLLRGNNLEFSVTVSPALSGTNELQIVTTTAAGDAFDPIDITATLEEVEQGVQPIDVVLEPIGPGTYAGNVQLFPGEWTLEIKALVSEIEQDVVTDTVPVG